MVVRTACFASVRESTKRGVKSPHVRSYTLQKRSIFVLSRTIAPDTSCFRGPGEPYARH